MSLLGIAVLFVTLATPPVKAPQQMATAETAPRVEVGPAVLRIYDATGKVIAEE